ncbi:hypothetical protein [Bacillus sp. FSL K6-2971]|uniref:hypothetical protein n=1 Tax=Bacillus sp. FSL K6-2971 TaxID=2921487 RepID=UPI0030FBD1F3
MIVDMEQIYPWLILIFIFAICVITAQISMKSLKTPWTFRIVAIVSLIILIALGWYKLEVFKDKFWSEINNIQQDQ